jgi:cell division protein FtsQ
MAYSHALGRHGRRGKAKASRPNRAARSRRDAGSTLRALAAAVRRILLAVLLLAALGGLCLGCLAGYRWMTSQPFFAIQDIQIEGAKRLTYGEIVADSGLELGQNNLAVNLAKVENSLARNPWIESLAVRRVLPDAIALKITEREPAFWVRVKNKLFYAGPRGEAIAPVQPDRFASLPYLELGEHADQAGPHLKRLLAAMRRKALPFGLAQTNWVGLSGLQGLELRLTQPRMSVLLGREDLAGNLNRLEQVWEDLARRGELERTTSLTVRQGKAWAAFGGGR